MYARRCSYCGAYLDPGERCDCRQNRKGRLLISHIRKRQMKNV